jgi:hypothetical protein
MGYIRDHAIVVVGTYGDFIDKAHAEASRVFPQVTSIAAGVVNGSRAFMVPPDGSKEGWDESHEGDARRHEFVAYLRALAYDDGSSPLSWVEVVVRDDDGDSKIERSHGDTVGAP